MIADSVGSSSTAVGRLVYDAEHFFDGYRADRDYALSTLRAARRPAPGRSSCATRTAGRSPTSSSRSSTTSPAPSRPTWTPPRAVDLGHPHPQRRRARGRQLAGRRRRRGPPRPGDDQRLRRACRQREHGLDPREPRAEDRARARAAGGGALEGLTELSRGVAEIANITPNDYQPYVGRSAFAHKGGVHGAAVAKVERSYQHIDPAAGRQRRPAGRLGARRPGQHAIRAEQLGHQLEGVIDPARAVPAHQAARERGPRVRGRRGVVRAADPPPRGRLRRAVPDRRLHLSRRAARGTGAPRRGHGQGRGRRRDPPHGRRRQRPGERAGRRAAQGAAGVLPAARRRPPVDYKVRILDGDAATAARTRVIIDSQDGTREWSTMGSDTNIIAASAIALADSLEYAIWKSGAELRRRDERHFTTASMPPRRRHDPGRTHGRRPDARPRPTTDPADTLHLARWTVTSGSNAPQPGRGHHRRRRPPLAGIGRGQRRGRRAVPGRRHRDRRRPDGPSRGSLAYDIHALGEGTDTRAGSTSRSRRRSAAGERGERPRTTARPGTEHHRRVDRGLHRGAQRSCSPRSTGPGRAETRATANGPGSASPMRKARRAELDEEAGRDRHDRLVQPLGASRSGLTAHRGAISSSRRPAIRLR